MKTIKSLVIVLFCISILSCSEADVFYTSKDELNGALVIHVEQSNSHKRKTLVSSEVSLNLKENEFFIKNYKNLEEIDILSFEILLDDVYSNSDDILLNGQLRIDNNTKIIIQKSDIIKDSDNKTHIKIANPDNLKTISKALMDKKTVKICFDGNAIVYDERSNLDIIANINLKIRGFFYLNN